MSYEDPKNEELDIPDFVEDKDEDSDDVDMSIFKMSDEELYDDADEIEDEMDEPRKTRRKKSTAILVLGLVFIGLLLITSIVSIIFAVKEHNKVSGLNTEVTQLKASNTDLMTQVNALNATVDDLNKKLEEAKNGGAEKDPNNKYPKGTVLYITEQGQGMGIKKKASMDSDFVDESILDWGDKITLVSDAVKDSSGNYWGEIDSGFIRIEYNGEVWASVEEQ